MFDTGENDRLARTLKSSHTVTNRLEVWSNGSPVDEAPFDEGSVTDTWVVAGVRRNLSLKVRPSRDWLRFLGLPGLELKPFRGVRFTRSVGVECPMGAFPVDTPGYARPVSGISVDADDWYQRVVQGDFASPAMSYDRRVVDTIQWLVAGAGLPWAHILTDSQVTAPGVLMDRTRHDAVLDFTKAHGFETFMDRTGYPVIADAQLWTGVPVSEAVAGGTATGFQQKTDTSKVFNMVSATSSAQGVAFDPQIAEITDTLHPAHHSRIGYRMKHYSSPLLLTAEQAMAAAQRILERVAGVARSYTISCVPDPTRDAGDHILGSTFTDRWIGAVNYGPYEVTQILSVQTPLTADGAQTITTASTQVVYEP